MEIDLSQYEMVIALAFAILAAGFALLLLTGKPLSSRATASNPKTFQPAKLPELVAAFGENTNSIYHLYGKFSYFQAKIPGHDEGTPPPLMAYVQRGRTNLMLMDPLCPEAEVGAALRSFLGFCRGAGRDPVLFAVRKKTAEEAARLGCKVIQIGIEPVFDLKTYDPETLAPKLKSAVRQVLKKGVVIEPFTKASIHNHKLLESLNTILHDWFMSRSSDAFKLLTEVNPLAAAEDKIFFVARQGDHVEAFLACSPIPGRRGHFLHDLIRSPMSVNGVADALVVAALRGLKEQGYEMASLGISPLAGCDGPGANPDFPKVGRLLGRIFRQGHVIYHFSSLYHFKKKFLPTREEPAYAVVPQSGIKIRHVLAMVSLFSSWNLVKELQFKLKKWHGGYDVPTPLAWALVPPVTGLGA